MLVCDHPRPRGIPGDEPKQDRREGSDPKILIVAAAPAGFAGVHYRRQLRRPSYDNYPKVLIVAGHSALEQTAARAYRRAQLPGNVGQTWTTEEESRLVAAYKSGDSPVAIASLHGRTLRAIEARLEKLGLITAEQRTTRGGFTGVS